MDPSEAHAVMGSPSTGDARPLPGFTNRSYGAGFADVYDDWYGGVSPVGATIELLAELAGSGPVLELGVGTGRLAIPLSSAISPRRVWGIDTSPEMLAVLASNDSEQRVITEIGDMEGRLPAGPFSLVFVAYNTLFNLDDSDAQRRCFANVAQHLHAGGRFVVEAFVPDLVESIDESEPEQHISVRSMTATEVVLSVSRDDPANQRAGGQFIELRDGEPVRLRPWAVRYSTVAELDAMATDAGMALEHRWADVERTPFNSESPRHVSVYRLAELTPG